MKKVFLVVGLSLFLMVGCGKKQVTCTMKNDSDASNFEIELAGKLDGDKVKKIEATLNFENETDADEYCSILALFSADEATKTEYKCEGKKVIIKNYDTFMKLNTGDEFKNMDKKAFIEYFEKTGMTCSE